MWVKTMNEKNPFNDGAQNALDENLMVPLENTTKDIITHN